jgi:hypothetical protein
VNEAPPPPSETTTPSAINEPLITPPLECQPIPSVERADGAGAGPASFIDPPPSSQLFPDEQAHALLAIDPHADPYKVLIPGVCLRLGAEYRAKVQLCVSAEGKVVSVHVLEPSIPLIDEQLPIVMGRWLFHPYSVAGTPTGFCYQLRYRVL